MAKASILTYYVLPVLTLALLITGFVIQKRNRSPYSKAPMDDESRRNYRIGERLGFLGIVIYLIQELTRRW